MNVLYPLLLVVAHSLYTSLAVTHLPLLDAVMESWIYSMSLPRSARRRL